MYTENNAHKIVFTHSDVAPSNILVNEGYVVGIVDWQDAGLYPEYWGYATAVYGCAGSNYIFPLTRLHTFSNL